MGQTGKAVVGESPLHGRLHFDVFFMLTALPVLAASPNFSEGETYPLKACEENMNAAQGELIDELDLLIDELDRFIPEMSLSTKSMIQSQSGEKKTIKDHIAKMQKEQLRAQEAIQDSEENGFDEMIAQGGKKKGGKCAWEEAEDVQKYAWIAKQVLVPALLVAKLAGNLKLPRLLRLVTIHDPDAFSRTKASRQTRAKLDGRFPRHGSRF
jgi:hypothetical protein